MAFKNFTVSIDEDTLKDLKRLSFENEESQKDIVNRILKDGINKEKNQTKLDED